MTIRVNRPPGNSVEFPPRGTLVMMKRSLPLIGVLLVALQTGALRAEQQPQRSERLPSIDDYTNNAKKMDGYFPIYWDERRGALLLEISKFDTDFLFSNGLSAGLGSNDIGLDRGEGG